MKKLIILLFILTALLMGCASDEKLPDLADAEYEKIEHTTNQYENLCVPTQMTKIDNDYFIVDCYHSQILYSDDPYTKVSDWNIFTSDINMGHTVASDGVVYLCDDTENNRVLIYAKEGDDFYYLDQIEEIGKRPHFISYDEKSKTFYVLSSLTGEFYLFKREKNTYEVNLAKKVQIPQLKDVYVRTFTFIDGLIYLPAGNGFIYEIDPKTFDILSFQALPPELGGPTQITKIGNYYYLSVSTDCFANSDFATLVRAKSPDDFINAKYESLKNLFCDDGTPYLITEVDDKYYLAWHSENGKNCMWEFDVDNNDQIINIRRTFDN